MTYTAVGWGQGAAASRAVREGDGYRLCGSPNPERLDSTRGSKSRSGRGFKGRGVRGFGRVQVPGGLARFGEVRAAQRLVLVRAQAFLRVALSQFSPDSI